MCTEFLSGCKRESRWLRKHLRGHQSATGPLSSLGTYSALVPSYNSQKSRPQAIHLLKPQFLSLWLLVSGYPGLDYVPQIYTLNSWFHNISGCTKVFGGESVKWGCRELLPINVLEEEIWQNTGQVLAKERLHEDTARSCNQWPKEEADSDLLTPSLGHLEENWCLYSELQPAAWSPFQGIQQHLLMLATRNACGAQTCILSKYWYVK